MQLAAKAHELALPMRERERTGASKRRLRSVGGQRHRRGYLVSLGSRVEYDTYERDTAGASSGPA